MRVRLRHVAEPTPDRQRVARRVETQHAHRPTGWPNESQQRLEQGALPRPVRTKQTGGTRRKRRVDTLQDPLCPKDDAQLLDVDDRYGGYATDCL